MLRGNAEFPFERTEQRLQNYITDNYTDFPNL
jgi:hypothetical protein